MSQKALLNALSVIALMTCASAQAEEKQTAGEKPVAAPTKANPFAPPPIAIPAQVLEAEVNPEPAARKAVASPKDVWDALEYVGTVNGIDVYSFNGQCHVTAKNQQLVESQCLRIAMRRMHNTADKP